MSFPEINRINEPAIDPNTSPLSFIDSFQDPIELGPLEQIFTPEQVGGIAAWQMLVNNGALRPIIGEAAIPREVIETVSLRAAALALNCPMAVKSDTRQMAVAGLTSSWIWAGGDVPTELEIIQNLGRNSRSGPWVKMRNSIFDGSQVSLVSGIWVTNPERTIRDLALWYSPEVAIPQIHLLMGAGASLQAAEAMLERAMRLRNRPAAREILKAAHCQLQ